MPMVKLNTKNPRVKLLSESEDEVEILGETEPLTQDQEPAWLQRFIQSTNVASLEDCCFDTSAAGGDYLPHHVKTSLRVCVFFLLA